MEKMETDFAKIEKLQGADSWVTWKFQIRQILESFELYDIVTGTEVAPVLAQGGDATAYAKKLADWRKMDAKARRHISTALAKQPLLHVLNCNTSAEMWTALKLVYGIEFDIKYISIATAIYVVYEGSSR